MKPLHGISALNAQITAQPATWHILRCASGSENKAIEHLAARRFAVYLPMLVERWQGPAIEKQAPMFPGYLFAFIWNFELHLERLRAVPVVVGYLADADGRCVVVPDGVVRDVQEAEFELFVKALPRSFRRKRRNESFTVEAWRSPNYGFSDPDRRIAELHRALGLSF